MKHPSDIARLVFEPRC